MDDKEPVHQKLCWRITHKVEFPREWQETFLCHHTLIGFLFVHGRGDALCSPSYHVLARDTPKLLEWDVRNPILFQWKSHGTTLYSECGGSSAAQVHSKERRYTNEKL